MNSDVFQMVITLLGGLALFIYGMNLMSDGLQKAAGEKILYWVYLRGRYVRLSCRAAAQQQ